MRKEDRLSWLHGVLVVLGVLAVIGGFATGMDGALEPSYKECPTRRLCQHAGCVLAAGDFSGL
ncbi:MAG: hypothetical protein L0215_11015 [Gemmataceae bacterium]|nr:hypothetical protein [Gemmataceae bacterium]